METPGRHAWLIAVLLICAGCVTTAVREAKSVMLEWPAWSPTPLPLLDSLEFYPVVFDFATAKPFRATIAAAAAASGAPDAPILSPTAPGTPSAKDGPIIEHADAGTTVTFGASADGTPPFFYTWMKDGQPMPGATQKLLKLENVTTANDGVYVCIVANASGKQMSPPIKLIVRTP